MDHLETYFQSYRFPIQDKFLPRNHGNQASWDKVISQVLGILGLFLPGLVILYLFGMLKRTQIRFLFAFPAGVTLSIFLIAVPTTIIYYVLDLKNLVSVYFDAYSFFTLALYLSYIAIWGFRIRTRRSQPIRLSFRINPRLSIQGALWLYVCVLFIQLVLITVFTSILLNFDALALYLPAARALIDPFSRSLIPAIETLQPPLMPAIYAWMMHNSLQEYLRFAPILLLTTLMIETYLLGETFRNPRLGLLAVIALITSSGLEIYMWGTSLYLDLPLTSFFLLCFLELTRVKIQPKFMFLMLGVTISAMVLAKETGVFLGFLVVGGTLLFFGRGLVLKIAGIILSIVPFLGLIALDIISPSLPNYPYTQLLLVRAFLLTLFSVASIVLYRRFRSVEEGLGGLHLLPLTFLAISLLFYSANLVRFGALDANYVPSLIRITGVIASQNPTTSAIPATSPLHLLDLYLLFQSSLLVLPLLLPLIAGLLFLIVADRQVRVENSATGLLLYFFLAGFLAWDFLAAQIEGSFFRRGLILLPLMGVIASFGAERLMSIGKVPSRYRGLLFTAITSVIAAYSLFSAGFGTLYGVLNVLEFRRSMMTTMDLAVTSAPWLVLLLLPWIRQFITTWSEKKVSMGNHIPDPMISNLIRTKERSQSS